MKAGKGRLITNSIKAALEAGKTLSEGFPSWSQPFVKLVVYVSSLVFILILLPISIPLILLRRKKISSFFKFHEDLKTKWFSESSESALSELRSKYRLLRDNYSALMTFKGFRILPYGRFRFWEYMQIAELLYHWELQHNNWEEGNVICDEFLSPFLKGNKKLSKSVEIWIVYKAKIIRKLEGDTYAQKFLIKHIDPNRKNSPVKNYLYELRKAG